MTTERYKHDAALLKDGKVLIFGGSDPRDWRGRLQSAEVFDPKSGSFQRVGDMNLKRFKISNSSVRLDDGRVLVAGGAESAEVYDPESARFQLVKNGEFGNSHYFATATLLRDGRALVVGGYRYREGASPLATSGAWIFEVESSQFRATN